MSKKVSSKNRRVVVATTNLGKSHLATTKRDTLSIIPHTIMSLNLEKGQSIDLQKDGAPISKVRVGLSWDVKPGITMDLDLFVVQKDPKKITYFNDKTAIAGVQLSEDNLTGEGDGDDEWAKFDATVTPDGEYFICVNIYQGGGDKVLGNVANAQCTVYNDETDEELVTYKLTEDGGLNTAIVVGKLVDAGPAYKFHAIGEYKSGSIEEVANGI